MSRQYAAMHWKITPGYAGRETRLIKLMKIEIMKNASRTQCYNYNWSELETEIIKDYYI